MDSVVHSHRVYKSVWSPVIREQLSLEKEPTGQSIMILQYVAVIKDSQIVGRTPSEIYSQITWYYITQRGSVVRCPASVISLGE